MRRLVSESDRVEGEGHTPIKIVFVSQVCYLDTHNGASVATRTLLESLARRGHGVAAVTGAVFESQRDLDPLPWLAGLGLTTDTFSFASPPVGLSSPRLEDWRALRRVVQGVDVLIHRSPTCRAHHPDECETREFLGIYEAFHEEFRPDVILSFGGDALAMGARRLARAKGAASVFVLHNFSYRDNSAFTDTDAIIAPSRFAAAYYTKTLGRECRALSNLVDPARIRAEGRDPRYVTFINPSCEKGVYVFVRIADELGRKRPDIPLLVVEGRGTERTLVDCGIDLRAHGNVSMMGHTPDPRQFWGVTRIALMPSLWWENQPLVAIEAMINGIPVIGSDRGGIPEALGDGGIVLGIPPRLMPTTRELPTADEVRHWVKTIINLWDDSAWYDEMSRRALAESRRWAPEVLEPQYVEFFRNLRPKVPANGADQ